MVTEKEFLKVLNNKDKGPKPYDTTAEVVRVEDGIAWVHIDGGVEETPAELTINAKKGDLVKVRLVGGQAYLIGNGTAPPTDDRVANNALGVASSAQLKAAQAEAVALGTEQKTKPAITSMTTYYKLSNGTPAQPTEADHDGWSEEEPLWDADSDEQLYYSVRYRTVEGVIIWTYPHVLSSYANMAILQNAILFEVGEGSSVSHIDDSNGDHILDNTGDPLIAVGGSIRDAFAYTRIEAASIRSEVAETYVDVGASQIHSLSSVMEQTAAGVNIYATIDGEVSDTHAHISNSSFSIVQADEVRASFGIDTYFWGFNDEDPSEASIVKISSAGMNVWNPQIQIGDITPTTSISYGGVNCISGDGSFYSNEADYTAFGIDIGSGGSSFKCTEDSMVFHYKLPIPPFTETDNLKFEYDGDVMDGMITGDMSARSFVQTSDERKKDILDEAVPDVSSIEPIVYKWKDTEDETKHIGYSAQAVEKILPDAVTETNGIKALNYIEVLVAKIASLEKRIAILEGENGKD